MKKTIIAIILLLSTMLLIVGCNTPQTPNNEVVTSIELGSNDTCADGSCGIDINTNETNITGVSFNETNTTYEVASETVQ